MKEINRRDFIKIGMATSLVAGCGDDVTENIYLQQQSQQGYPGGMLTGNVLSDNAGDYTGPNLEDNTRGDTRMAIPSACWQCVARDGIIGYVENGRVEHLRGNPRLLRTNGKLCSRGQSGVNHLYDPDRLLFPMKRAGSRGSGQWVRVSWDQALDEIVSWLKPLLDAGQPEKFMFHYGRMKASSEVMIKNYFLTAYGTATIGNHTSICEGGKWVGQELTWGKHYDTNDVLNTNFILNFGCNVLEAHTNHIPLAQRVVTAIRDNGVEMYTFDVRLSNTAAKSTQWIPIKPGTDLSVVLAMAYVIMVEEGDQGLYDSDFIETWTTTTVAELKNHLQTNNYTPEWAAEISGVPADTIRSLATKYAGYSYKNSGNQKGATIISYRGAVAHYNGVMCERAIMMLAAICGNIERPGGNIRPVGAKWTNTFPTPSTATKKLDILNGLPGDAAYPDHNISHRVLDVIEDGSKGRPVVYMIYCYNPVYANGNWLRNERILKDESLIPYCVAVDVAYSEGAAMADLIIPDANYLERWDWENEYSMNGIKEYYIRQPLVQPLGEARDFKDVCVDLANRMGINIGGWSSAEEFVRDACNHTADVVAAAAAAGYPDGFSFMKAQGAYYDPDAHPKYQTYLTEITDLSGAIYDVPTGVWWKGNQGEDYTTTKDAYKKYVGQQVGDKVYQGFTPDKVNKSGLFEIYSKLLESKGLPALPTWMPIPEHEDLGDKLILTTFKVNAQTQSRSQNCKYISEIYHRNIAWINPNTASQHGISDGDTILITNAETDPKRQTEQSSITIKAHLTQAIAQGIIAVSHHCGHAQYGRYATANQTKNPLITEAENTELEKADLDANLIWWSDKGVHPNWIIPNSPDPIGGQLRFMDTVVEVQKV